MSFGQGTFEETVTLQEQSEKVLEQELSRAQHSTRKVGSLFQSLGGRLVSKMQSSKMEILTKIRTSFCIARPCDYSQLKYTSTRGNPVRLILQTLHIQHITVVIIHTFNMIIIATKH